MRGWKKERRGEGGEREWAREVKMEKLRGWRGHGKEETEKRGEERGRTTVEDDVFSGL